MCVIHWSTYVRIARSTSLPCITLSLHSTIASNVTEVSVKIIQINFFFKLALKVIGCKFLKRLKMIFDETDRTKLFFFFLSFFSPPGCNFSKLSLLLGEQKCSRTFSELVDEKKLREKITNSLNFVRFFRVVG